MVPVISDGQRKRIVRRGAGMRLASTSVLSVRAISRLAAHPLALSLAPGFSWSRWQLKTISPAAGVGAGDGRHQRLVGDRVVVARARRRRGA